MPELPEVETTRRGIAPNVEGLRIDAIVVRQAQLRWPVPQAVQRAVGQPVRAVRRRAKYLLLDTARGSIVLHLGMSGSLTVQSINKPVLKHDHLDIVMQNGVCLRFNDARRFGSCLWQGCNEPTLSLLASLGPEPLTDDFDGNKLFELSRSKSVAVKKFIMDNKVVVGVGNIYANESLFIAGIDPRKQASKVTKKRYTQLADIIKKVLASAIEQGGTTLKDFVQADGQPGYFSQQLLVYGRAGENCDACLSPIKSVTIGQRNTFFCDNCQS